MDWRDVEGRSHKWKEMDKMSGPMTLTTDICGNIFPLGEKYLHNSQSKKSLLNRYTVFLNGKATSKMLLNRLAAYININHI